MNMICFSWSVRMTRGGGPLLGLGYRGVYFLVATAGYQNRLVSDDIITIPKLPTLSRTRLRDGSTVVREFSDRGEGVEKQAGEEENQVHNRDVFL